MMTIRTGRCTSRTVAWTSRPRQASEPRSPQTRILSAQPALRLPGPRSGHDDLVQLHEPGTERSSRGEKVVAPDPAEALPVADSQRRPGTLEVPRPGQQRAVVVRTDVVDVLRDEQSVHR